MLDDKLFCCMFQQRLLTAANQFGYYSGLRPEDRFQHFLALQLGALGRVEIEEKRFRELFDSGCGSTEYLPRHLDGVDLSLGSAATCGPDQLMGFELKVFFDDYSGVNSYRNVEYFRTGKYSESSCLNGSKGSFLQAGHFSFCKEGQLLQDFCRAARILARQKVDTFILAGLLRYDPSQVDAKTLEERLDQLLTDFFHRPVLYCHYKNSRADRERWMIYARLTPEEMAVNWRIRVLKTAVCGLWAYRVVVCKE